MAANPSFSELPDEALVPLQLSFRLASISPAKGYNDIKAGRYPRTIKNGARTFVHVGRLRQYLRDPQAYREAPEPPCDVRMAA